MVSQTCIKHGNGRVLLKKKTLNLKSVVKGGHDQKISEL